MNSEIKINSIFIVLEVPKFQWEEKQTTNDIEPTEQIVLFDKFIFDKYDDDDNENKLQF